MFNEQLALEHYRLHLMERWPDGPRRKAGLAAAQSRIESLSRSAGEGANFVCAMCSGKSTDDEIPAVPHQVYF